MDSVFSKRLKMLRLENKKTQQDLADFLGVRRSTYGEYERGKIVPPYDKLERLAGFYSVSVDWLVGNTNFKTHEEKFGAVDDIPDISNEMKQILDQLQNDQKALMFNGQALDDESRALLTASLENSLKMALLLSKKK